MFKENGLPEYNRGPYLAEHTEEILSQYGYTDEEISKMIEDGAAVSMDPALRD
jgi:cinnamoyl-CoA:phenyllactate CoA-transferase